MGALLFTAVVVICLLVVSWLVWGLFKLLRWMVIEEFTHFRYKSLFRAIEQYEMDNGQPPEDLSMLVPEYLDRLPVSNGNEVFRYDSALYLGGWGLKIIKRAGCQTRVFVARRRNQFSDDEKARITGTLYEIWTILKPSRKEHITSELSKRARARSGVIMIVVPAVIGIIVLVVVGSIGWNVYDRLAWFGIEDDIHHRYTPLFQQLLQYEEAHEQAPDDLSMLVPGYMSKLPLAAKDEELNYDPDIERGDWEIRIVKRARGKTRIFIARRHDDFSVEEQARTVLEYHVIWRVLEGGDDR